MNKGVFTGVGPSEPTAAGVSLVEAITVNHTPGTLFASTGVGRLRFPWPILILGVSVTVGTAPTGAALIIDVLKNGVSIFTQPANRPTIAISTFSTVGESYPDVPVLAAWDYLTQDIIQIGTTVAGADMVTTVRYRRI